jgi:hypothetical protein
MRNTYKILVGNPDVKKFLEDICVEYNIKQVLKERVCNDFKLIQPAQDNVP